MSGGHVLIQSLDGIGTAEFSVLLVHVVGAGAGIISKPDTKVLDLERVFLVDDVQRHNLTGGLLDFSQLLQEIPESRFGDDFIGSEDSHPVQFRGGVAVGGQVAANDLVFLEATYLEKRCC